MLDLIAKITAVIILGPSVFLWMVQSVEDALYRKGIK